MVIDFHAHIFPDELAPKAMKALRDEIDDAYPPVSDGTAAGLLANMDAWGIDASVVLPVVTKHSQTRKANEWSAAVSSGRLIGFGGIYPHGDNWKEDIDLVVSLGLKGLKFHAEYQDFLLDDERMLKIYDYALGKGLVLVHHAGFDPAFPPPYKTSPRQFLRVAEAMRGGVIVASHLGGHAQWDDVERYLAGSGIYLDTSMGFGYYPPEQFLRIVKKHGAGKVLFGSDAPWSNAREEIAALRGAGLTQGEKAAILGGNAVRLLGL
ncbi:MAG: amidohydrolase family protein [Oscillospiraceae bacterium]|jgi:predicted TIM-barrel fold metal-dependent hydrolase|nr:amidohydrolase family protein [Oscillospiraceae bacterium]